MEEWIKFVEIFGNDEELFMRLFSIKIDLGINWAELKKMIESGIDLTKGVITIQNKKDI